MPFYRPKTSKPIPHLRPIPAATGLMCLALIFKALADGAGPGKNLIGYGVAGLLAAAAAFVIGAAAWSRIRIGCQRFAAAVSRRN